MRSSNETADIAPRTASHKSAGVAVLGSKALAESRPEVCLLFLLFAFFKPFIIHL
jgi:hypothetical protein